MPVLRALSLDGPHFLHVGTEVLEQVFDAVAQRRRGTRTAGASPAHVQEHHAILEALEGDVAAIIGNCRAHARVSNSLMVFTVSSSLASYCSDRVSWSVFSPLSITGAPDM
jgi:sirohydrochlorin ferrochelatase